RAGRLVIDVEITRGMAQPVRGHGHGLTVTCENRTRQRVWRCGVQDTEDLLVLGIRVNVDGKHRPEDLLAHGDVLRVGDLDDGRLDEETYGLVRLAAGDDLRVLR